MLDNCAVLFPRVYKQDHTKDTEIKRSSTPKYDLLILRTLSRRPTVVVEAASNTAAATKAPARVGESLIMEGLQYRNTIDVNTRLRLTI